MYKMRYVALAALVLLSCKKRTFNNETADTKAATTMTSCKVEVDSSVASIFASSTDVLKEKVFNRSECASAMKTQNPDSSEMTSLMQNAGCNRSRAIVSETGQNSVPGLSPVDPRTVDAWDCGGPEKTVYISGPASSMHIIVFDPTSKSYNFYSADHPRGGNSLFFHGNSHKMASVGQMFRHPCTNCHVGGGLLMRELRFPWPFWQSNPGISSASQIAASKTTRLTKFGPLFDAEHLERDAIRSISRANQTYVEKIARTQNYQQVLKPLFCDTGLNYTSSATKYPASGGVQVPPDLVLSRLLVPQNGSINLTSVSPAGFREDTSLLGSESDSRLDMDSDADNVDFGSFNNFAKIPVASWKSAAASNFRTGGSATDGVQFPMLIPVRSFADDDVVSRLVREGIVSQEFAVSILMVDIQSPVLSANRCKLLQFVPKDPASGSFQAMEQKFRAGLDGAIAANKNGEAKEFSPHNKFIANRKMSNEERTAFVETYMNSCSSNFAENNADKIAKLIGTKWNLVENGGPLGDDSTRIFADGGGTRFGLEGFVRKAAIPEFKSTSVAMKQDCTIP